MERDIEMGNIEIGKIGEEIACEFIVDNGYRIIGRNINLRIGEIDIFGVSKEGISVFFEVKTLIKYKNDGLKPEDNMTKGKMEKLRKACAMFSAKHPELLNYEKGWRIDLVAIEIPKDSISELTKIKKNCTIRHYENV